MDTFLETKFKGKIFDDHSIPIEYLENLIELKNMIISEAKNIFRQEHPAQNRLPKGFKKNIDLKLFGIKEGSAVAQISANYQPSLYPSHYQFELFEKSRDRIISTIQAANEGYERCFDKYLSQETLIHLIDFGTNLKDKEQVEFSLPGYDEKSAIYTKEVRQKFIECVSSKEYKERISIYGIIFEADQKKNSFYLQTIDDQKIPGTWTENQKEIIMKAFNEYATGQYVQIDGIGIFNKDKTLQKISLIDEIVLLDKLDITLRLNELRKLKDGWMNGVGYAFKKEDLDWLSSTFDINFPSDLIKPYIYPTIEGNIQFEWSINGFEISLLIDLNNHYAKWHSIKIDNIYEDHEEYEDYEDYSTDIYLDSRKDWEYIVEKIKKMKGPNNE